MMTRRYVILHHTGHGEPHFDLMLEADAGGPLRTWRLSDWPPGPTTVVTPLPDHRRHYLTHEGDVGNGRGRVRRVASGAFEPGVHDEAGWRVVIASHALRLPDDGR